MNCQNPVTIRNPALKKFRNEYYASHGYPPSFDVEENFLNTMHLERMMVVPCGKCLYCFLNRQDEWRSRLQQEMKYSFTAYFVTLTYDELNCPNDVDKVDVQKFLKRLRSYMSIPLRYFLVSEYTPTGTYRPHYHFALFFKQYVSLDEVDVEVRKAWQKGFVTVADLNDGRIDYISTYCIKFFNRPPDGHLENFMLCSRRPFIGADYLTSEMKNYHHESKNTFISVNGYKHKLPRIYRDKIFDDVEKVELREKVAEIVRVRDEKLKQRIKSFASELSYEQGKFRIAQLDYASAYNKYRESKKF